VVKSVTFVRGASKNYLELPNVTTGVPAFTGNVSLPGLSLASRTCQVPIDDTQSTTNTIKPWGLIARSILEDDVVY
jgi:hypothetical protein